MRRSGPGVPRPDISYAETAFARARLRAGFTRQQLADATGLSKRQITRFDGGAVQDPRLRALVNVWHVLRSRLPELELVDLLDERQLEFTPFPDGPDRPPTAP